MAYKKARKIYRKKSDSKKKRLQIFFKIFITLVIVGILGFGLYQIGNPLIEYIKMRKNSDDNQISGTLNTPTETFSETISMNETETTVIVDEKVNFACYSLPNDALSSVERFESYIKEVVGLGFNAVSVVLKDDKGYTHYKTESEMIKLSEDAIVGELTAKEIVSIAEKNNLEIYANLNLLEDNNRYGEYKLGSYHTLDGSTWLDNSVANGGKPWLSPFEKDTKDLAKFMSEEILTAGFDGIIVEGLIFPNFRNSDIGYIGEDVRNPDKYKALIELYNVVGDTAEKFDKEVMLKLDANEIVNNTAEVFKPNALGKTNVIVDYSSSSFSATINYGEEEIILAELDEIQKFRKITEIIDNMSGDNIKIVPNIDYDGFSREVYNEIINSVLNNGYDAYMNY